MSSSKRRKAAYAAARSRRAKFRPIPPDTRDPDTRKIALGGRECWCGDLPDHDWPGKDSGLPHPR